MVVVVVVDRGGVSRPRTAGVVVRAVGLRPAAPWTAMENRLLPPFRVDACNRAGAATLDRSPRF